MAKKPTTKPADAAPEVMRGRQLRDFAAKCKRQIERCGADREHRRLAMERLDFVVKRIGNWEINRRDMPSLPTLPRFHPGAATGKSYSNIPVPARHRHLFNGRKQHTKKWRGHGVAAWCHYLAAVEDEVQRIADPPEATATSASPTEKADTFHTLEELKGKDHAHIGQMAVALFNHNGLGAKEAALKTLKAQWNICLGYLVSVGRTRISDIDHKTLIGFRGNFAERIKAGRAVRTVNGYLAAFRRVLRACADYCEVRLPSAYAESLCNFTEKERASMAKSLHRNKKGFAKAEIVPMPAAMLRAWLDAVKDEPLHLALTMCSLNLAAGAVDLSELMWEDRSGAVWLPCVDTERQWFFTERIKTLTPRWTTSYDGQRAIRMMDRTRDALNAWAAHRKGLITDLTERRTMGETIKRAAEARRLKADGQTHVQIAAAIGTPVESVAGILKQPADRREKARSLAAKGYSLRDIVDLTGFSKASVSAYIRDMTAGGVKKPHSNRHTIVTPDPNRIFFVPSTGRPLVNQKTHADYVDTIFKNICTKAGIKREADILKGRVSPPKPGEFVLPLRNGHYIFRRTAATVAGMLGKVSERSLQNFLGHDSPEMTRKYLHNPPPDYHGLVRHDYRVAVKPTDDPIEAIEEFLDKI